MSKISMDLKVERRLIKTAQRGGESGRKAFGKIYKHYQPHLENFFRARLSYNPEIEDLVSEVFKKALGGLDSFRWQGVSLSAWLYKISRNVLTDHFRKINRTQTINLDKISTPKSQQAGPEETYLKNERYELLHQLLEQIPKREQKIIYFKFFEGRTNRWIAQELGLSETNIGTIVHRSINKLRKEMVY